MSKTDIDKMFEEQILRHEKSSKGYKPEYWEDFEKKLNKVLPVAKKSYYWFSLNNILIVLIIISGITLLPILLLHSNETGKSFILPQTIHLVDRYIISRPIACSNNMNKNYISPKSSCRSTTNPITILNDQFASSEKINNTPSTTEKIKENQPVNISQQATASIDRETNELITDPSVKETSTVVSTDKETTITEVKNDQSALKEDPIIPQNKNKDKGKHHKKSRKKVLVPRLNYNGL